VRLGGKIQTDTDEIWRRDRMVSELPRASLVTD